MSQDTNHVSKVLKELDKTIQVLGTEKLLEILEYSRASKLNLSEEKLNSSLEIIQIVCEEFGITLSQFFDTNRNTLRRLTIGVSSFLIQKNLNLNNSDISYILKKPDELVSLCKKFIVQLNSSHPQDKQILEKINNITNKLKNDN
jgi:hypothetical protein